MSENGRRNYNGKYTILLSPSSTSYRKSINVFKLYFHILIIIDDNFKYLIDN